MLAAGGSSADSFGLQRKNKCSWLQPEIASHIISFLDDNDIVAASGVCWQWYHAAARELSLRGKTLYRWPADRPKSASTLSVVGEKGIPQVLQVCKGIKILEISFDEPSKLSSLVITKAGELNLKKLILRNIILNSDNARALVLSEIPIVEICTKYKRHISKKSRKILLDNKELFTGIVISNRQPHTSLYGFYPNPLYLHHRDTLDNQRVILEAAGIIRFNFGSSLEHLSISNGFHITKEDILQLSILNLKTLVISDCNLHEDEWSNSFQNGFISLSFLSILNCTHLGLDTIRHLSRKKNLTHLLLDLRHLYQLDECIRILQGSSSLIWLNSICTKASQFTERIFFEKKWKRLKEIIIRNYGFIEMDKKVLESVKRKYELHGIIVKYSNIYTLLKMNVELNKNFQPIIVD